MDRRGRLVGDHREGGGHREQVERVEAGEEEIGREGEDGAGAVKVQLAGGTATLGADVAPFEPQTIAFPAGVTQQTISVATVDDAFAERPETVLVKLSAATAGTIEDSAGTLTIRDDD